MEEKREPQRREVRVEDNEYEKEQQCLVKQIKRVVILRNNHISCSAWFKNALTFSNSFCIIHMLCLPSQTFTPRAHA